MSRNRVLGFSLLLTAFSAFPVLSALAAEPPTAVPATTTTQAPTAVSASMPSIDEAGVALLKKSADAMQKLTSYRADCRTTITSGTRAESKQGRANYEMATLVAARPNRMHYDQWMAEVDAQGTWSRQQERPEMTFVSNGTKYWTQFGSVYRVINLFTPALLSTLQEPWQGFYDPTGSPYSTVSYRRTQNELLEVRCDGNEMVEGVLCDKVFVHAKSIYNGETQESKTTSYIGPDGLMRRQVEEIAFGGKPGFTRDAVIQNLVVNAPVANGAALFAYVPPKGVRLQAADAAPQDTSLLPKGAHAPDFTAVDANGTRVKLSDFRGKVVVVDFWASWCPPCKASMPHNQEVAQKLHAANVPFVLLAVDNAEKHDAFSAWVKSHPEFDALRFVYLDPKDGDVSSDDYRVSGIPTQYVIDAQGTVRASFVGYGGPTDDLEQAVRVAEKPLAKR